MARVAKPTPKPAAGKRKPGRPAAQAAKPAPKATKAAKPTRAAAAPKHVPATAAPAPKFNVAELRVQVEKLERSLATLRTKNREANRAAKADAARIAELEQQVGQLEAKAAPVSPTPAGRRAAPKPAPAPATRTKRQSRSADPANAVPPASETEAARESPEHSEGE